MHAFDVLGDPVRRRILELLADGELTSGAISATVQAEFGITQPAVSQHLKVLRESGFASVRPEGARRLYAVDAAPFREVDAWLGPFHRFWEQRLDSLATELARGRRERRLAASPTVPDPRSTKPADPTKRANPTKPTDPAKPADPAKPRPRKEPHR